MTSTIPNVPRELLERAWRALANSATGREIGAYLDADPCAPECAETCARASMCATCSAALSAPSPAGVDGLGDTAKLLLPALRQYMHNDGSGLLAGYDLETTQALLDGLREDRDSHQRACIRAMEDRNQLAKCLKFARTTMSVVADNANLRGVEHRSLIAEVNRIDAALSAGKEST